MMNHRATPPGADAATITATASAIADAASAALCSAADATCRHPMTSTASRWKPFPIATGVVSTVATDTLAATFTAAITASNPAAAPQGWRWSSPHPFERPACLPYHQCLIGCCVRRHYVCYADRLKQLLLLSLDWLVAARPVVDAAGGR